MGDQNTTETVTEQEQGKTFTQEQVNAIVGKRLAEQKATLEADFVKREQELNRREMSIKAKELLSERRLPESLADVLRYETEEELVKAINAIEHARGFESEKQAQAGEKQEKIRILEDKIPTGVKYEASDPIADAFKMKG